MSFIDGLSDFSSKILEKDIFLIFGYCYLKSSIFYGDTNTNMKFKYCGKEAKKQQNLKLSFVNE